MSKVGKIPIKLPQGVELKINPDNIVVVKGPKGELQQQLHSGVIIEVKDSAVSVSVKDPDDKELRSLWGLSRALINNMIVGTTQGYEKKLEINGVGYRAAMKGKTLTLEVGYSHPVDFPLPEGIEIKVEKNVITVSGINKQIVGEISAQIRKIRPPEPYKGKGIKYMDEVIRRKAGKVMKSAEGAK